MISSKIASRLFEHRLNDSLAEVGDVGTVLDKYTEHAIELAGDMRSWAHHYDGNTLFGAVGILVCQTMTSSPYFRVATGANEKTAPWMTKFCAEMALNEGFLDIWAETGGHVEAGLIAVYGISDANRIREITNSTDHKICPPCHDCINVLNDNPVIFPDTAVILANDYGQRYTTQGELTNEMSLLVRPPTSSELIARTR